MITVVLGPPAAGKSTYVAQRAKPGDITIDYDDLVQALTPIAVDRAQRDANPVVVAVAQAARRAAIDEAIRHRNKANVWIIDSTPPRNRLAYYQQLGARVHTVDPGYAECMRRAREQRNPRLQQVCHDWYAERGLAV